jgi:hypothetical protein
VAQRLRVSTKSVYQWRRRWRAGGEAALASRGPGGAVCRLSAVQLVKLRAALDGGPAAWGWNEDQRWTLARVTALIGRLFHVRYTLRGTSYLLHRVPGTRPVWPRVTCGCGAPPSHLLDTRPRPFNLCSWRGPHADDRRVLTGDCHTSTDGLVTGGARKSPRSAPLWAALSQASQPGESAGGISPPAALRTQCRLGLADY